MCFSTTVIISLDAGSRCCLVNFCLSDMQKFPLRMKDNDLLVTELYHDPSNDAITALSVYLTPKTSQFTSFTPLIIWRKNVLPAYACLYSLPLILFHSPPPPTPSSSPLSGVSGNWIEIAYGTSSGAVRVIVQHPETVGSGPQLFQTFTVHRSPVTKIMLSEKHLVSGEEGGSHQKHISCTSSVGLMPRQPFSV